MRQTRKQRGGEIVTCAAKTVPGLMKQIRESDPGRVAIRSAGNYLNNLGEIVDFDVDTFEQSLESSTPIKMTIRDKYNKSRQHQFTLTINSDNVADFEFDTVGVSKKTQALFNAREAERALEASKKESELAATGYFKPTIHNGKMTCPRCGAVEGGTSRYIAHDWNCPMKGLKPAGQNAGKSKRRGSSRSKRKRSIRKSRLY